MVAAMLAGVTCGGVDRLWKAYQPQKGIFPFQWPTAIIQLISVPQNTDQLG